MRLYIYIILFEFESIKMMKILHNYFFKTIIDIQRDLLEITDQAGDEGTNAQMSGYITEQEKLVWMYNAYLGK